MVGVTGRIVFDCSPAKLTPRDGRLERGKRVGPALWSLPWKMFAIGEGRAAVRAAEGVFKRALISNDEIQRIVTSWTKVADDASVLTMLRSYHRRIRMNESSPYDEGAIALIAACFVLMLAQEIDAGDFSGKEGVDKALFFLLRFHDLLQKVELIAESFRSHDRDRALATKAVENYLSQQAKKMVSRRKDQKAKAEFMVWAKVKIDAGVSVDTVVELQGLEDFLPAWSAAVSDQKTLRGWAKDAGFTFRGGRPRKKT